MSLVTAWACLHIASSGKALVLLRLLASVTLPISFCRWDMASTSAALALSCVHIQTVHTATQMFRARTEG